MASDFLWVEKYRPQVIEDCILPDDTKKTFKEFVEKGEIPNLLLAGPPGIGKTTIAKALCKELGADYYVINGSDEGRFLDTVRNQAKNFASTVSLQGTDRHKVIIIDEADNTGNDVQLLLRANIEAFYSNCRFIFTCNYKNKIIEPLHSRCAVVDFTLKGKQKTRVGRILFPSVYKTSWMQKASNTIKKSLQELINKHFPDFRGVLNECQRYSTSGKIDAGVLASFSDVSVNDPYQVSKREELYRGSQMGCF
jgi:DNA polymerase III delta prime subunit